MLSLIKIKLRMLELSIILEEAKATLVLSIFFVSCEEKDCYRDVSIGQVGFGGRSTLRVQPVNAMASSKSFFSEIFLFLTAMFPSASPRGTLRVSGKQNSLFPLWPFIKCILNYIVFSKPKETCCHLTLSLTSSVVIYFLLFI